MFMFKALLASAYAPKAASFEPTTVPIGGGVMMPRVNLGTCCGSDPKVGILPWFASGGVGVDTAWDYNDQQDIGVLLKQAGKTRDSFFITTKVPAGDHMPGKPGVPGSCTVDPQQSLKYVNETLHQLGVSQVDLVLLHAPCANADPPVPDPAASDNALWQGLVKAKALGWTRAIGVSNYNIEQLTNLTGPKPSVNQIPISITGFWGGSGHDDKLLDYLQEHHIQYQAYGSLRGCPFDDKNLATIATKYSKSVAQVCMRWVLQRGAMIAAGTGSNASTAPAYSAANLGIFDFLLSKSEMDALNKISPS
jgi:diketogulonate reductase-like aldo/keto reductase